MWKICPDIELVGGKVPFEAEYVVKTGNEGRHYTAEEFPDYGLTYDELLSVTTARKEADPSCNGYVVIVFTNMVVHNEDGTTETLDPSKPVLYYGVTYDRSDKTVYDIVGANSAAYYNFICDK